MPPPPLRLASLPAGGARNPPPPFPSLPATSQPPNQRLSSPRYLPHLAGLSLLSFISRSLDQFPALRLSYSAFASAPLPLAGLPTLCFSSPAFWTTLGSLPSVLGTTLCWTRWLKCGIGPRLHRPVYRITFSGAEVGKNQGHIEDLLDPEADKNSGPFIIKVPKFMPGLEHLIRLQ